MSQWITDSEQAFTELLSVHGESVEYSRTRSAVNVIVDWQLRPADLDKYGLDFRERNFVCVEFFTSAMTPPPKAGQFFTQNNGTKLDIKAVTRTDLTYRCFCGVGEAIEGGEL